MLGGETSTYLASNKQRTPAVSTKAIVLNREVGRYGGTLAPQTQLPRADGGKQTSVTTEKVQESTALRFFFSLKKL